METGSELLAQLIQQCPLPVILTNIRGEILYVNDEFCRRTGYEREELIGKNPSLLQSGKTPVEVYKILWETIHAGEVWQGDLTNRRKNGELFVEAISIAPVRNRQGAIGYFMGIWQDVTERKWTEEEWIKKAHKFELQSRTDDLTGLFNHGQILAELSKEFERADRYGRPLAAMMIDIDNFKLVNDRYGHLAGDKLLKTYAAVIRKSIRKIDIAGRFGGDEFLVILPESNAETAELVARRIIENVQQYKKEVIGDEINVTASIGMLARDAESRENAAVFIERVDQALYHAKRSGKNRIVRGEN